MAAISTSTNFRTRSCAGTATPPSPRHWANGVQDERVGYSCERVMAIVVHHNTKMQSPEPMQPRQGNKAKTKPFFSCSQNEAGFGRCCCCVFPSSIANIKLLCRFESVGGFHIHEAREHVWKTASRSFGPKGQRKRNGIILAAIRNLAFVPKLLLSS